jgi:sugar phosphate isomerase/epimerase
MTGHPMQRRSFLAALAVCKMESESDRIGVACHVGNSEDTARKRLAAAAAAGFQRIQVVFPWEEIGGSFLQDLPHWIKQEGLMPVVLSAYVNCVEPRQVLMSTRAEDFVHAIEFAGVLGCKRMVAWTGGYTNELMKSDPRNFLPAASEAIRRFLEIHLRRLEAHNLTLALETYNTLACPDAPTLKSLLMQLPNCITGVLDPPNLTPIARYHQRDQVLLEMLQILKERIGVVHLKDFRLPPGADQYELPEPFAGEMNYKLFIQEIRQLNRNIPLIAEHFGPDRFASMRHRLVTAWR